ncbi:WLM-domain-containing protein [Daldinia bambusicola]|nr:WLM-domain-containing protein [Daldinia bambusicola]
MPLGYERINARKSQPNDHIVFIKPLEGPDKEIAQQFLERIAAQCLPIMREHHISVVSLEEYEPNREFVGRNFNAGEVIQLVLKSLSTRQWLPFNYVQMVMMHELAHCKQMNHSKAFWAVRNSYADQMRVLWSKNYTGEGLWGRGALLETGEFEKNTVISDKDLPEHLCGGTYRSRGRKRRQKKQLSYQERKQRRILKKFGANGVALGEDEAIKTELEKGKKPQGKPRVAGSKRGRELRAAAALARFDQQKKEAEEVKDEPDINIKKEEDSGSETGSDSEEEEAIMDINGRRLVDTKGHNLMKVCEDEDARDEDAQNELKELFQSTIKVKPEKLEVVPPIRTIPQAAGPTAKPRAKNEKKISNDSKMSRREEGSSTTTIASSSIPSSTAGTCPMCSFDSGPEATICGVCSHVLDPGKVPNSWRCKSSSCRESLYLNAGDAGICGVCGGRKAA